jgi:hypothetical protein
MKVLVIGHQSMLAHDLSRCLTHAGYIVVGGGNQVWALRKQPISEGCWLISSLTFSSTLLPTRRLIKRNRSLMLPWWSIAMTLAT